MQHCTSTILRQSRHSSTGGRSIFIQSLARDRNLFRPSNSWRPTWSAFNIEEAKRSFFSTSAAEQLGNADNREKVDRSTRQETKLGKTTEGVHTLRRIAEFSKPEMKLIGLSAATLGITSSTTLLLPLVSGKVVDAALLASQSGEPSAFSPTLVAFGLFGLTAIAGGGVYIRSLLLTKAGNRIVASMRQKLFTSVLSQDAAYFDTTKPGDIITRLTIDAQLIQGAVTTQAVAALRGIVMSIGSTAMLFSTSTTLALVSLGTLPPIFLAARVAGQTLREKQSKVQKLQASATSTADEIIGGMKTVTQFVAEDHELKRYSDAVTIAHEEAISTGRTQAFFDSAVHIGANGAVLCVLGYGGTMVLSGTISAGDLTGFLMYSLLLAGNVSGLSGTYAEMMKAVAAADRVFEVMDRIPSIPPTLSPEAASSDAGADSSNVSGQSPMFTTQPLSVQFRNVNFTYPTRPDKQILGPNFSLDIRPGEVMALVGGSGSGKSTVAALLTRLYDVNECDDDQSCILVDGHDVRDLDPAHLRNSVGIVSQEPLLFDGTIEDNIRYGRRSATDEEVLEAARIAHVLQFTDHFPDGLKTRVGSRGAQLSGGQKQRVAIARLCVKDPPIVVFDEATSALDAESEHHVKEAIDSVMKGRTVISIAHRLSTIRGADRIAVIQHGKVAEVGTYEELVEKENGVFLSLMGRQIVGNEPVF